MATSAAALVAYVAILGACGSTPTATPETSAPSSPVPDQVTTSRPADGTATTGWAPTADVRPEWPTEEWSISAPEDQGVDSATLASLFEEIVANDYAIDSVTIVRNGAIVAEAYAPGHGPRTKHIVHSCTKSVVSTLIGIAIDHGAISGVEAPFLELFPGIAVENVDERKEALTLEDVLTMATGMDARDSYLYRWQGLNSMRAAENWTTFALSIPMATEPGTRFDYTNTGSYLLSSALQRATGMPAAEFADEHLFGPLGITDYEWPRSPEGVNIGWGELWLTPHDMAKFGYLVLRDGNWEGTQVVPAGWVDAATEEHIAAGTLADGYGYQWWVDDSGYFMALGYAGQYIVVIPGTDGVIVFTSDLPEQDFFVPRDLVDTFIIPAMKSPNPLPANPPAEARLDRAVAAFQGS